MIRARAAAGRADEPAYLRSETLRLLKEQEHGAPTTLSNHPNPSGLPVCFMCTRPILGVMARAAGKNLHGDCLSCATCGNSLRNVGHHFIEDKFYCDIHGTQRKAGGRPGMDPNIFVKSSPTAAQPVHVQQESPRAAYHPQINQYARPVSVSPVPSAGGKTVTTHYHTPKTQGILSPAQRGVPNAAFGADLSKTVTYGGGVGPGGTHYDPNRLSPAPSQFSQGSRQVAPPPVPSNPPPSHENSSSSRVPDSVRSAVSPRRTGKVPRQWPPPQAPPTNRYWQIDPADALKKEKEKLNYGEDLAALIKEVEAAKGAEPPKKGAESKRKARRASNISKEQVKEAFEEHRKRKEAELRVDVKGEESKGAEPKGAEPPKIESGIHWTVIHSPVRSPSPAKVTSEPSDGIFKPIPKYATPPPIQISKTATPVPFQAPPISQAPPIPLPRSPELSPVRSYIVRSSDANITTSTELQTTVTRFSAAPPTNLAPPTAQVHDQSTSPIPSIRLHRKNEKITVPTVSVEAATSPIKVKEATPTQALPTFRNQAPPTSEDRRVEAPPTFKIDRPYEAPPTRPTQLNDQAPPTRYEAPPTLKDTPIFPSQPRPYEAPPTHSVQQREQTPPLQAPPPRFEAPPTFQPREQTPPLLDHTALMDQVGRPSEYTYNPGSIRIHEPTGPRPLTVSPKPFLSSAHIQEPTSTVRKDAKHFKKVDFSKTSPTVIPKTEWKDSADIIDESDILTEEIDDCSLLKAATYDGDESEMIDDVATFEIEEEEILEVSRPSKIRVVGKSGAGGEAEQLWRQRAMELLDDDAQTERDLMIVAALNERLQGRRYCS
ncbi:hypothetical protein B9Z55_015676 [Caenorhabditis nigoni]|uniref:LIM zinc-binding domain-containing protein n=1 Tax=Caenorhabditis nigoni TaxID=1611254 RepID=A0A2G5UBW6_9PELO|nr:hypothetical protein B9Z55_015676 [Caenorhabditis nigoni]